MSLTMLEELERVHAEWFAKPPSSGVTPTSPQCTAGEHAACWRGCERPPNYVCWRNQKYRNISARGIVATFRRGWSAYTHDTSARIATPVEHYTCDCNCHSYGYVGQQLDIFEDAS